jgi:hypothetical protein
MLIILYCPRLKPPGGILRANSSLSIADQYQYEKQMRSASTLFRIETLLFRFFFPFFRWSNTPPPIQGTPASLESIESSHLQNFKLLPQSSGRRADG